MSAYTKEAIPNVLGNKMRLTQEQVNFIHENVKSLTPIEIAEKLDLRYSHVSSYISRNRLTRIRKGKLEMKSIRKEIRTEQTEYFNVDSYFLEAVTI